MATRKFTDDADDAADSIEAAGLRAGVRARRAGGRVGDAIDQASDAGSAGLRRTARKSAGAYDATIDQVDGRAADLGETIRQNPLAATGVALLIGVVLGRFIL